MTAMAVVSTAAATSRVGVRVGQGTKARNSASARGAQVHASAAGTQALFSSWTHDSTQQQLPERVQDYLSLLAESSTTGNMQKHLVKLMVKGAGAAVKAGGAALNPMDALTDVVAGAGTDFLLRQVTTPNGGWSKLRQAVLGASAFRSAGKTRDDSYTPPPAVDPMHAKALGVLVSVLMSGAVSGAAHAMPDMPAMQPMHAGVEMTQSVSVVSKFEHAGSLRAAPSFALRADSGAELVGSGGMAASTALKLLRADSKVADTLPDLKDIFSSAMTSIEEECEGNAIEKLSSQPKGRPGFGAGFGSGGGGVRSGAPTA